ncbi:MAG TPA: alanine--glyoxylate aminotransferase family protein [Firmicutes bacterium]|nr:alanine--glyoxylate aminotransferase family protein [Bacillota bacterium]
MRKGLLMIPGPTQVPPQVFQAMSVPMINHRGAEFEEALGKVISSLKCLLNTKADILIFPGSGTGAMEAAAVNLVSPGEEVAVITVGAFGDRFAQILEAHGAAVHRIEFPWGAPADPSTVKRFFDTHHGVKCCFLTHNETSTGVLNEVKRIRQAIPEQVLVVVDAVSSLGATPIAQDEWGLDVVVTASQKALMVPPGLAVLSVNERAMKKSSEVSTGRYYWDFRLAKKFFDKPRPQTPYTPAVSLVLGLEAALKLIEEEGLERVYRRHAVLARGVRQAMRAIGLEVLAPEEVASPSVTAVKAPGGLASKTIISAVRQKFGVVLAGGQGHLTDKIFRIGHIGYVSWSDVLVAVAAVEMALHDLGCPVRLGSAAEAVEHAVTGEGTAK